MPHPILQETVTRFDPPEHHYALLYASGGELIAHQNDNFVLTDDADDSVIWDLSGDTLTHVLGNAELRVSNDRVMVTIDDQQVAGCLAHGPELLPSEYLNHIREHGLSLIHI